jgi:osmotically-inducible protein OsmY
MNRTETFALGVAVGAGMVYLLDPDKGRRRRALIRDQLLHVGHELDDAARSGSRHVRNRAFGLAHEARAGLMEGTVDDRVLEERVRSAVGRKVSNPGSLTIEAQSGRVILSGDVPSAEVQELVRTTRAVRGVDHVENRLHVETNPGSTPGLQGSRN